MELALLLERQSLVVGGVARGAAADAYLKPRHRVHQSYTARHDEPGGCRCKVEDHAHLPRISLLLVARGPRLVHRTRQFVGTPKVQGS